MSYRSFGTKTFFFAPFERKITISVCDQTAAHTVKVEHYYRKSNSGKWVGNVGSTYRFTSPDKAAAHARELLINPEREYRS